MSSPLDTSALTLAALIDQARQEGSSIVTLRALVEEASELGADRALRRLGLHDDAAGADMREVRTLLDAWREAKKAAGQSLIRWLLRFIVAAVAIAATIKLNLSGLFR